MFIDKAEIQLQAGEGGDGCIAFHREKYVPSGGPSGGDGGKGGDLFLCADDMLSTLNDFRYRRKYRAEDGAKGESGRRSGKQGQPLTLRVPRGTLVRDAESGRLLADISEDTPTRLCKGGRGGWGNARFATPTRQTPRFAKAGTPGEKLRVSLELKLLADVGLLGYPNVGKSSFLRVVSQARPVVGNYPFTTISPALGVVTLNAERSFVIADIPGLIEGASKGAGLGRQFLRHVERCRMLLHILDAAGSENRDPLEDYAKLNAELADYLPQLAQIPQIIAGNKIDLATAAQRERLKAHFARQNLPYFEMSAPIQQGTGDVIQAVAALLTTLPPVRRYAPDPILTDDPALLQGKPFSIEKKEDGVFFIEAQWLLKILNRCDMDDYESLQYFQRVLRSSGVIDALIAQGVCDGDTVCVYDFQFEYVS
jgi:GTP-binding protein